MSSPAAQGVSLAQPALPTLDAVFRAFLRDVVREVVREELTALRPVAPAPAPEAAPAAPSPYLTPRDAAGLVGVSEKTIRAWAHSGKLHAHRIGRLLRIERGDLERCIQGMVVSKAPVDVDGIALQLLQGRGGRRGRGAK